MTPTDVNAPSAATGPDVYPGAPDITEEQAIVWLRKHLDPRERAVENSSVKFDLTDNHMATADSGNVWFLDNYSNVSNQSINATETYQYPNSWNTLP